MPNKDLTGLRFGKLTVTKYLGRNSKNKCIWECTCDCGNIKSYVQGNLVTGNSKSCGCTRHVNAHGLQNHRLYGIWRTIKQRCGNENATEYQRYGGSGITVCEDWLSFVNFYEWAINNGYFDNLTIDRLDNTKGYCPSNCKWSTPKEQAINRKNTMFLTYKGETKSRGEWCRELNIKPPTLQHRLRAGWTVDDALGIPIQPYKRKEMKQEGTT